MAKFLIAVWPLAGHYIPNLSIAHSLRDRGHEVGFYTGNRIRHRVEKEGFRIFPFCKIDENLIDEIFFSNPISPSKWNYRFQQHGKYRKWLVSMLQEQVIDLNDVLDRWNPDAIICDPAMWSPYLVLQESRGTRVAIFDYLPACLLPGPDVPPLGFGFSPPRNTLNRLKMKLFGWTILLATSDIRRKANTVRLKNGLAPLKMTVTQLAGRMPLYLVAGAPEIDFNRRDLPECVHYIGPCLPVTSEEDSPPCWMENLRGDCRWVHISEGTVHIQDPFLLKAAANGLANLPIQVIMATGSHRSPKDLGLPDLAPNIHVKDWIPYQHLLPRIDLVVTTGGAGTVLHALNSGIPLVVVPTEWDKPDTAQRVVESGAGLRLSPRGLTPKKLRKAVETVLSNPEFRGNAEKIAISLKRLGGADAGAQLLENWVSR